MITYTVTVENTGNVTVTGIALSDTLVTLTEQAFSLAPGAKKEITYTYTVTQANVDAGEINNTVTATGKDPKNADVTGTASAKVTAVEAEPELTVTKTASKTTDAAVGDVITYTISVENTGNVTVTGITLKDAKMAAADAPAAFDLAPRAKKENITYTYTVTQADFDAGEINNTVLAKGKDPKNNDVTGTASAKVTAKDATSSLSITKSASKTSGVNAGDEITYTVVVTNTGNVSVKDGVVTDEYIDDPTILSGDPFNLAPNGTKTYSYIYTVTQDDIDSGSFTNTAKANATAERGDDPAEVSASVTVEAAAADAALQITKTANKTSGVKVGDTITYTITVKNAGNVTLRNVEIAEQLTGVELGALSSTTLTPGQEATATATYTVTQADVDKGEIVNVAKANATAARGENPDEVTASVKVTTVPMEASVTVAKSITSTGTATGGKYKANETVEFQIVVKNTGNVTLTDATVIDMMVVPAYSGAKVTFGDMPTGATLNGDNTVTIDKLAPGASVTLTASYTVTQADVDKQATMTNAATVAAKNPQNTDPVQPENPSSVTFDPEAKDPSFTVVKSVTSTGSADGGKYKAGETVQYQIVVTNTGNVTLSDIEVEDQLSATDSDAKVTFGAMPSGATLDEETNKVTITKLDVGASVTLTASYTVTQEDVDAQNTITNVATAKAVDPGDDPVDPDEPTPVPVDPEDKDPSFTVVKSVTSTGSAAGGKYKAGETVQYQIVVTNTGNVTLSDIEVEDQLSATDSDAKVTFGAMPSGATLDEETNKVTITKLDVGASVTLTASYTVTQADVDAQNTITNVATATAVDPGEDPVDPDEPTPVPVDPEEKNVSITVDKSANRTTGVRQGNTVRYTITVTNSGNVTLNNITVSDTLVRFSGNSGNIETLAPGASVEIIYTYTATAADVNRGRIRNTATATGTAPDGTTGTGTDSVTVRTTGGGGGGGDNPPGPGPGGDDPEVIPDEPVPEVVPEVIPDDPTPTAGGVWALINLISAILTALGAIIALFRKKEEEDEDEQNMYKEEDEDDNRGKKMLAAKIAGALAGVAAPITFILTEDMSLPMALVDKWTVLMVAMLAVQVVAAVFNKKASELNDDDDAAEATAN